MPEYNTLADELQRLVDVTDAIGEAIANQGGTVDYYDRLEQYPADIATIGTNIGTKTITDDSTIEFVGDGNPLLEYTIKGNMVQNGTPAPTSPITPSECGDKTANLWNAGDVSIALHDRYKSINISLPNGTYTISAKYSSINTGDVTIGFYDENNQIHTYNATIVDGMVEATYTGIVTVIRLYSSSGYTPSYDYAADFTEIMLVSGSTALPYEPYGQYKLPFDINDFTVNMYLGEVETTRRIKKIVFDGTEIPASSTQTVSGDNYCIAYKYADLGMTDIIEYDVQTYKAAYPKFVSTHFKMKSIEGQTLPNEYNNIMAGEMGGNTWKPRNVSPETYNRYIIFCVAGITTTSGFQAWLAQQYANGTPVTVWYVLAEPTTGTVDEPLRKIGDYVDTVTGPPPTVPTIEGTNTLKVATTLNPSETFIKYRYIENVALLGEKTITTDGTYIATDDNLDGYSSVTVEVTPPINAIIEPADDTLERALGDGIAPPTPVPPTVPEGTVRFIDYVGSVIHEYPSRVFLGSTSLPSNPTHEGLASQGWNWTLADAKAYVTTYGSLDIGQMYVTSDGKTRLHIRLGDGRLKPYLGLKGDSSGTAVSIDWGDGSESESFTLDTDTVYTPHEYSTSGEYTISITVDTGSIALSGYSTHNSNILRNSSTPNGNDDKVYQNSLIGIEIGNNVSIGAGAFQSCYSLQSITIPDTVTSIGGSAFANCYSLTSITIPDGVTSIGSYTFQTCCSLSSITIPDGVTSISDRAFYNCYSLSSITIPDGVTSISGQVVRNCYSLTSITIPDTVTSIGVSAFQNCFSLQSITIPDGVTSIGSSSTFYGCYSLQSITIPDTVTSIGGSAFANCYSLTSITIPDTVTSIGNQAFMNCNSLTSITIPDSVTSIDAQAFDSCFGLGYIKFEPTTPPAVTSSDAWTALPTDCIIMVPSGTLTAYKTATNYPDPTTYTYVEY